MLRDKIVEFMSNAVKHPTNEFYVSEKGIFWISITFGLGAMLATFRGGLSVGEPITIVIPLSFAIFAGMFLLMFFSQKFGKLLYNEIKNEKTKKLVIILLYVLILSVFLLPFVLVYVFKLK